MSSINIEENFEEIDKNSSEEVLDGADSEGSCQTEEEIFNETFSDSILKPKSFYLKKKSKNSREKNRIKSKNEFCRLNLSVRCGRRNHFYNTSKKSQKIIQRKLCKKNSVISKNRAEKSVETPKKGKRCRAGGKAKGKPPELDNNEKAESDEENENYFFSRISLGFFQKYRDLSGASTSYQLEDDHKRTLLFNSKEKVRGDEISEEMELLELQNWGMTNTEKLEKIEYLNPDTF